MCRLPLPAAHLPLSHGDGGKKGRENLFLNSLVKFIEAHDAALLLMSMLLILVLLILVICTMVRLSSMNSRYRAMMRGSTKDDLEGMLIQHVRKVEEVEAVNVRILEENELIRQFIRQTLVRVPPYGSVPSRTWAAISAMRLLCSMQTTTASFFPVSLPVRTHAATLSQ